MPKTATAIAPTIWSIIRTSSGNRRRMGSCTMVRKVDTARGGSPSLAAQVHILPLFINAFFRDRLAVNNKAMPVAMAILCHKPPTEDLSRHETTSGSTLIPCRNQVVPDKTKRLP